MSENLYQGAVTGQQIDKGVAFAAGAVDSMNYRISGVNITAYVPVATGLNGASPDAFAVTDRGIGTAFDPSISDRFLATRQSVKDAWYPLERSAVRKITFTNVSSLPINYTDHTITMSAPVISEDMEVIHFVMSNPSAQSGDWTVTTANRSVTVSGSILGTTDITLYLAKPYGLVSV